MIVTIGGIPVYDALILDGESGMLKISLVDDPAVMSNFQTFDSTKRMQMYAVQDEEKRLVRGVIMRADFPIYRRDDNMGEYYIIYKAETIRQMAEKYLVENRQNNFNLMHEEDSDVEGVQMVQFFIKDSEKGVSPSGFEEIADGSLFGEFHIVNDEVWDEVKNGTYKGFSLEGIFDLSPEQDKDEIQEIVDSLDGQFKRLFKHNSSYMSKLSRFKEALAKALAEFGNITTDKGVISWDGDDDLKEGDLVYIEDSEGNRTTPEDGDYKTDDNKTIVVVDGKVSEIKDPETEVAPVTEEMGQISTDNGVLLWNGEEDLKEGDEVFVEKDGENVPAENGEYKTEDGKVIKVEDGKVASITDADAEVAPNTEEETLKRKNRLERISQAYEDSYEEKERKILDAISATLGTGEVAYLVEAGENYAVICLYEEGDWEGKYIKFEISWSESGDVVLGSSEEVKSAFVPVDAPNPADTTEPETDNEEEFQRLQKENEELKKEVEKLKKTPGAKPAHEELEESVQLSKTGDRKLDKVARYASLAREASERRRNRK